MMDERRSKWLAMTLGAMLIMASMLWSFPSSRACIDEQRNEASSDQNKENRAPFPIGGLLIVLICTNALIDENEGVITAAATVFIAFFTLTLWGATRGQLAILKRSVDALPDIERAYVFFNDAKVDEPQITLRGTLDEIVVRKITAEFWNHGKTPAIIIGYRLSCGTFVAAPDPGEADHIAMPAGAIVGADMLTREWTRPTRLQLSVTDSLKIEGGSAHAYLFGEIVYRDIFKREHRTWFCRRWTGKRFVLADLQAEELNGYD